MNTDVTEQFGKAESCANSVASASHNYPNHIVPAPR
jgi:hypothetical protein